MSTTLDSPATQGGRAFRDIEPLVWKPRFLGCGFISFCPLFIAGSQAKVVDDVLEAEALSEQEHDLVSFFRHSDFAGCVR